MADLQNGRKDKKNLDFGVNPLYFLECACIKWSFRALKMTLLTYILCPKR